MKKIKFDSSIIVLICCLQIILVILRAFDVIQCSLVLTLLPTLCLAVLYSIYLIAFTVVAVIGAFNLKKGGKNKNDEDGEDEE